ncbi:vacuolar membrane PQ loop repeat protein [Magnaporthiopsis poae ATCC 64411]|uniref:Vacuolar membrane PQ loop repeat protein n=1 Tax=Magnaporthiopsis poae (strain ATCC 64411 / 73-15) TaxID=644358 RepID=A0A0C4DQ70_MAGP6|nr:vacuolar membrane PQ loop repeat protein [Magnaporthiopsis poae ATCC 64411]
MGAWDQPSPDASEGGGDDAVAAFGLVMGYVSAVFYLCARIPQIWKNYKEKSCEGLALLFFLLSLTGNFTYGVSLVAYSQDRDYLLKTIPWLLGSLGTIVEDCIIFVQFRLYDAPRQDPKTCASGA